LIYCTDSTAARAIAADQDASKCNDPTDECYYGYGYAIVSTGQKVPIVAELTETKQTIEETAMRVRCGGLAIAKPIWMVSDSAYDTLNWHCPRDRQVVVPVASYNARNTYRPKDLKSRVKDRIGQHSENVRLK